MGGKTQKELMLELHQGVFGVPDTEDKGLIGDVKELVVVVKEQNTRIRKNEQRISKMWGVLLGIGAVGGTGLGMGIKSLLGG